MTQKFPRYLTYFFLAIFTLQLLVLLLLLIAPAASKAADLKYTAQIPINGFTNVTMGPTTIGEYIRVIYKYAIGFVGLLATIVMMFGGILWITAGGAPDKINNAKEWIVAALTGLVLALCSFVILVTINPELGTIKSLNITKINDVEITENTAPGCCIQQWTYKTETVPVSIGNELYAHNSCFPNVSAQNCVWTFDTTNVSKYNTRFFADDSTCSLAKMAGLCTE